jgi:hypothetical protein
MSAMPGRLAVSMASSSGVGLFPHHGSGKTKPRASKKTTPPQIEQLFGIWLTDHADEAPAVHGICWRTGQI